jgi:hypothetical protein
MKTRTKIIIWAIPLLLIVLTFILIRIYITGIAVQWELVGKPSESISRLVGVNFLEGKLIVLTESDELYSLKFSPFSVNVPVEWTKENNLIKFETINNYGDGKFTAPPTPFNVKQIFIFVYPGDENSNETRFALSDDGSLWHWCYRLGAIDSLLCNSFLVFEIMIILVISPKIFEVTKRPKL